MYFNYINLDNILYDFYKRGIQNLDITLLVSLGKESYEDENIKRIIDDFRRLFSGKSIMLERGDIKEKFNINKLNFFVGDALKRHMIYYDYCVDYFKKYNVCYEEDIPEEIRAQFEKDAYVAGMQKGKDWFRNNLEAFQLFSNEKQLTKDFIIGNDTTTIFEETEDTPGLDYMSYEHWYKHPRYNEISEVITKLRQLPNSVIERCYDHEAKYYYERLARREGNIEFKNLFIQQSKKYLIDETVPGVLMKDKNINNHIDMYFGGGLVRHLEVYQSKAVKKNAVIQEAIRTKLRNVDNCYWITIKNKD